MDLHGQIMNLPAEFATRDWCNTREAYLHGHRDARHAAAELANEQAEMVESYQREMEAVFDIAQRLDAANPELAGAFTGTPSERIRRQLAATGVAPDLVLHNVL